MSELLVQEKEVVIPGQILAKGMDFLPAHGTFREEDNIISSMVGLVNLNGRLIKIIPLTGPYIPRRDDVVIGKVVDIGPWGWRVDIRWAYQAMLSLKDATQEFIERGTDLTQFYNIGDILMVRIVNVSGSKVIDLGMKGPGLRKLTEGRMIQITPSKVPRLIGKQGSMITMIKDKTETRILVGQNGNVWISGMDPVKEKVAVDAIDIIDKESQSEGLTDSIEKFLNDKLGIKKEKKVEEKKEEIKEEKESKKKEK
ncbi:MAG: exosome complex RNA-binding protein Rrp4 [Candidatus Nanoarchaeia archaeon]